MFSAMATGFIHGASAAVPNPFQGKPAKNADQKSQKNTDQKSQEAAKNAINQSAKVPTLFPEPIEVDLITENVIGCSIEEYIHQEDIPCEDGGYLQ